MKPWSCLLIGDKDKDGSWEGFAVNIHYFQTDSESRASHVEVHTYHPILLLLDDEYQVDIVNKG